ncbi:MAG TPA: YggS family pyridoxal phosphate-dependent enzyme [Candidatus Limnocylindrales bacterium]
MPAHLDSIESFRASRAEVLAAVAEACRRVGRNPADVTLVAVSKTVDAGRLASAVAAGLTVLGENRVQEAESKAPSLPDAGWHLIGPLQSNKARRAVELFDVIQSVDSVELAQRLDRIAGEIGRAPLEVYLQVNVDRDESKAGFLPETLARELPALAGLPNLALLGLMTVGRLTGAAEEARPTFVRLRELSVELRTREAALGAGLSMGMSGDYAVAVEEGATLIRVGRALFGARAAPAAASPSEMTADTGGAGG